MKEKTKQDLMKLALRAVEGCKVCGGVGTSDIGGDCTCLKQFHWRVRKKVFDELHDRAANPPVYHKMRLHHDSRTVVISTETVNHPAHYNAGSIEVIEAIEDWRLGFNDGNAVKYIARAPHKGDRVENWKKAIWYLERAVKLAEAPACAECGLKMGLIFKNVWRCSNCGAGTGCS